MRPLLNVGKIANIQAELITRFKNVGYDNERGKCDRRHIGGKEEPNTFSTVEQLVEDFIAALEEARSST